MRKDEWFISPEIFFSCLLVLTVAFIIADIVLLIFNLPISYAF